MLKVTRKFHFTKGRKSSRKIAPGKKPKQIKTRKPNVSKLLALAIYYKKFLAENPEISLSMLAKAEKVSRARMTQIMNLNFLSPDIQWAVLSLPQTTAGRDKITSSKLQKIALTADWDAQQFLWRELIKQNFGN